jgi:hypothetical protein
MAVDRNDIQLDTYSPNQTRGIYKGPIVSSSRAPGTSDKSDIGTIWINKSTDTAYILTSISSNLANWENFTDEVTAVGTDGQLWIAATGAAAAWANLTSTGGSVTITNAANSINLEAAGVAALTSLDGDSGTATPVAGVINIVGGTNITTAGAGQNMTVNLDASPSLAGSLTVADSITMSAGTLEVTADDNASQDIYLLANGGVSETIEISVAQGTGVGSLDLNSVAGGIDIDAGLASADAINITASDAAGGIDIDAGTGGIAINAANGAINIESGTGAVNVGADAAAHTVTVGSTNTTAATVVQSGTGDVAVTSTDAVTVDATGVLELNSSGGVIGIGNDAVAQNINVGTGAAARTITIGNGTDATAVDINCGTGDVTVGTNATAHTVTVGSTNTTSNVIVQSGTGGIQMTSGGTYAVDATDALTIESSAGTIGIGVDAVAQAINIGTGAAARTVTVGNGTGATSVVLESGTGAINIGTNAVAHTVTVGTATGAGATTIQSGTGAVNIGTNAVAHTVTVGTTTGAGATTIQSGTGALALNAGDALTIDSAGVLELNSSAGVIGIGNDAVAQNINIGTGAAARTVTLGNATGATTIDINAGTGGVDIDTVNGAFSVATGTGAIDIGSDAAAKTITIGNKTGATTLDLQGGTGLITLDPQAGAIKMAPAATSVAGTSVAINAYLGSVTYTGQTTASGATQVFTVTNSIATTISKIFVTVTNIGANDAQMTLTRVEPKAGSIEFTTKNNGAAALNGNVVITFWIIQP